MLTMISYKCMNVGMYRQIIITKVLQDIVYRKSDFLYFFSFHHFSQHLTINFFLYSETIPFSIYFIFL